MEAGMNLGQVEALLRAYDQEEGVLLSLLLGDQGYRHLRVLSVVQTLGVELEVVEASLVPALVALEVSFP